MDKSKRLQALLHYGYFPDELPPPFTAIQFAKYRASIGRAWDAAQPQYPKTSPEIYSIPRIRGVRRDLAIVNPIAEYYKCKLISDNCSEIKKFLSGSSSVLTAIDISVGPKRAVATPEFAYISLRRSEISALYDFVLITDISRFYSTIYTHTIPWAMHTKAWCKINLNNNPVYNAALGVKLDIAVRKGNDNQTMGIPVGPDSSRIISEIIAVALDKVISKLKIPSDCAVRNVDDWCIGFDSQGQAEDALSVISAACRDLQLDINNEKTAVLHSAQLTEAAWPTMFRDMTISKDPRRQGRDFEHYFNNAFQMSENFIKENVLDFAVKRTMGLTIDKSNWHRYETYLLKAARANATTLPTVVKILASYNARSFPIDQGRCRKLIVDLIRRGAPNGRHSEVAWALFLAKALKIKLDDNAVKPVSELDNSICALITLDLRSIGLVSRKLNVSLWQQSMNSASLRTSNWLLAYEANVKGWLTASVDYIGADPYFSVLRDKNISFYDLRRNVKDIRKTKPLGPSAALTALLRGIKTGNLNFIGGNLSAT